MTKWWASKAELPSENFTPGAIDLTDTQITDADLVRLEGLKNLQLLWLDGTQITNAGLAHIKGLTNLRWMRRRSPMPA